MVTEATYTASEGGGEGRGGGGGGGGGGGRRGRGGDRGHRNILYTPLDDLSVAGSLSRQVLCFLLDGGDGVKGLMVNSGGEGYGKGEGEEGQHPFWPVWGAMMPPPPTKVRHIYTY